MTAADQPEPGTAELSDAAVAGVLADLAAVAAAGVAPAGAGGPRGVVVDSPPGPASRPWWCGPPRSLRRPESR